MQVWRRGGRCDIAKNSDNPAREPCVGAETGHAWRTADDRIGRRPATRQRLVVRSEFLYIGFSSFPARMQSGTPIADPEGGASDRQVS